MFLPLPLPLHLFLHFTLALAVGYFIGRYFNKLKVGIIAGIVGGFFIDFDHILEYFLVFGPHFNLVYFFTGRQFLVSDQVHLWFHAWEYVPLLFVAGWLFKRKKALEAFFITLALAIAVHLLTDSLLNKYPLRNYSVFYRSEVNFSAPRLLDPGQYQKNLETKKYLGLD